MSMGELVIGELECEDFVVPNISSSYVLDETSEAIGDDGKGEEEDETGEE